MNEQIDLNTLYEGFIQDLKNSVEDRSHGFHIIQFGTWSQKGPQIRSVVLRRVELQPLRIYFHTHLESPKISEIRENDMTAIHAYCGQCRKQLRFQGRSRVLTSGPIYQEQMDHLTPSASRCYLTAFAPSSVLPSYHSNIIDQFQDRAPTMNDKLSVYPQFAVIEFIPSEVDALFLRAQGHMRLQGTYQESGLQLTWVAP